MGQVSAASTILIDAEPAKVLDAVADYQGVRPRILSPQYSEYRVLQGGHDIPEATIRRRFAAGLHNFEHLYAPLVDAWALYDNAGSTPLLLDWSEKP